VGAGALKSKGMDRPEASVSHPLDLGDGRGFSMIERHARPAPALGDHVRPEELVMIGMIVELVRGESGQDGLSVSRDVCTMPCRTARRRIHA
jgi:hypothetical protein